MKIRTRLDLVMLIWLASAGVSWGQAYYPQAPGPAVGVPDFAPAQPSLSPYLNLLRRDQSVLSPYHTFVVPQRRQLQSQVYQASRLQQLEGVVRRNSTTGQSASRERVPTGSGSYFNRYLHFYPVQNAR